MSIVRVGLAAYIVNIVIEDRRHRHHQSMEKLLKCGKMESEFTSQSMVIKVLIFFFLPHFPLHNHFLLRIQLNFAVCTSFIYLAIDFFLSF